MQPWTSQSEFTDPGRHAARLAEVGPGPDRAAEIIQGLLIHGEALERYGLPSRGFSRETLPVRARLAQILAADDRPLPIERSVRDRTLGTCRDYAILLCAAVRQQGLPARARCGFAAYFSPGAWQDHWICEVRSGDRWRRIDAQLDPVTRAVLGVAFDPRDLPASAYLTADEAWRECRAGRIAVQALGHDDTRGLWFAHVNLVRDQLALTDEMTSAWDDWRAATAPCLSPAMIEQADRIASAETGERPSIEPWWLA